MVVTSSDELLVLLDKSGLFATEDLAQAKQVARDLPDAKQFARHFIKQGRLTKWQAAQLLSGRNTLRLGKYRLLAQLDASEVDRVFLAEHVQMNRRVALKVLKQRHSSSSDRIERFMAEAGTVASLDHRNVIHVFDVESENDRHYLVMEYIKGQNLQAMVEAEGPLTHERVAEYLRQIASGLAYIHQHDLIHGDIQPVNLIVDPQDTVKILNTGVTQLAHGTGKRTKDILYASSEQALGGKVDHRTDLFSLGCVGYFMLIGRAPLPGKTYSERIEANPKLEPPDVLGDHPEVPESLIAICRTMISNRPQDRYPSAAAVVEAIEDWQQKNAPADVASPRKNPRANKSPAVAAASGGKPPTLKSAPVTPIDVSETSSTFGPSDALDLSGTFEFEPASRPAASAAARPRRKSNNKTLLVGVLALVAVAGIAGIGFLFTRGGSQGEEISEGKTASEKTDDKSARPSKPPALKTPDKTPNKTGPNKTGPNKTGPNKPEPVDPPTKTPEPGIENPPPITKLPPGGPVDPPTQPKKPPKSEPEPQKPELRGFAESVTLPAIGKLAEDPSESLKPLPLGKVVTGQYDRLEMELLGGDLPYRGNYTFVMGDGVRGSEQSNWEIMFRRGNRAEGEITIARLTLAGGRLSFAWTEATQEEPGANFLRNGLLKLTVGDASHQVRLRKVTAVAPLVLDLDKARQTLDVDIDWAPEPEAMIAEIWLDGDSPSHDIRPQPLFVFDRGSAMIHFNELLLMEVRTVKYRNLQFLVSPLTQFNPSAKPEKFSLEKIKGYNAQATLAKQKETTLLEKLNNMKKPPKEARRRVSDRLAQINTALGKMDQVLKCHKQINGKVSLHFRIVCKVGQQRVLLATTDPDAPGGKPDPNAKDPNAKDKGDRENRRKENT